MRAQIAITRTGVTQASSNHEPPDGGVLARRTNGDFRVTLHRKVSETALVQLLRSLRALAPDFQMSLEMGDRPVEQLTRQQACHHIALRALGTLERTNETAFMSNLELFDSMLPPTSLQSDNLLRLAKLDLANKDAPTALMQASAANIKNLVSVGQNRSMRLYFLAHPTDYVPLTAGTRRASRRGPRHLLASMAGACLRSRLRHSGAPVPAWFPEASWRFHAPLPAIYLSNHPASGTSKQLQGAVDSGTDGQSRSEHRLNKVERRDRHTSS